MDKSKTKNTKFQKFEKRVNEVERNGIRIPPQNIDSERALLGSIMLRPDALI
jgi:hypothetical protein